MTKIELYNKAALDLITYLEVHKEDIIESNDTFGMLKSVLKEVLDIDDEIEGLNLVAFTMGDKE